MLALTYDADSVGAVFRTIFEDMKKELAVPPSWTDGSKKVSDDVIQALTRTVQMVMY
eukprot:SAG31_NODE_22551_length_523_cov_0.724057_2_plen_57_part_00